MTIEVIVVDLDGWLVHLSLGWRLANPLEVALAGCGHDGAYSIRMWKPLGKSAG